MDSAAAERAFKRVLFLVVVSEILVALGALYFFSPTGKSTLAQLKTFANEKPLVPLFLSAALFTIGALMAFRGSRKLPEELVGLSQELGIQFSRKWGNIGGMGGFSLSGYGSSFQGAYGGTRVRYAPVTEEGGAHVGGRLYIEHSRPLSLGLLGRYHMDQVTPGLPSDFGPFSPQNVDARIQGLKVWAVDQEKASILFKETDVSASVKDLIRVFEEIGEDHQEATLKHGFLMCDRGLTAIVPEPSKTGKRVVDAMVSLSQAITTSPLIPAIPISPATEKAVGGVFMGFFVLLILTITAMAITKF